MHVEWTPELYASLLRVAALADTIIHDGDHESTCLDEWKPALDHILSRASLFGHTEAVSYNRKADRYRVKESFLEEDPMVSHALEAYMDAQKDATICQYVTEQVAAHLCTEDLKEDEARFAFNRANAIVEDIYKKEGVDGVVALLLGYMMMDQVNAPPLVGGRKGRGV
jgi:hypothetical protein